MTPDPAKRWRALSPSTQWAAIFDLMCEIRDRDLKLKTWPGREEGGGLNKTKARTAQARDRALLDLLRAATPPEVWERAERAAGRGAEPKGEG